MYKRSPQKQAQYVRNYRIARFKQRYEVFLHYGLECAACREKDLDVLSIDHIFNDGAAHRLSLSPSGPKTHNHRGGDRMYRWLVTNGFPEGFQTLCMNCNWSKFRNGGVIPAKRIKRGSKLHKLGQS